jgi:hypothetical protein
MWLALSLLVDSDEEWWKNICVCSLNDKNQHQAGLATNPRKSSLAKVEKSQRFVGAIVERLATSMQLSLSYVIDNSHPLDYYGPSCPDFRPAS